MHNQFWNKFSLVHYSLLGLVSGIGRMILTTSKEVVLFVPAGSMRFFLTVLRNGLTGYYSLMDILVVDYPNRLVRFEVQYILSSFLHNARLVVKTFISANEAVDSISNLFPSASWLEREAWDLFGVFFFDHSDLRRILTDYGFEGHPLRKDFPLSGFTEIRYDETLKRIVVEPLELTQLYRVFDFLNPWSESEF